MLVKILCFLCMWPLTLISKCWDYGKREQKGFYKLDAKMHGMIMDFTGYKNLTKVTKTGWVQVDRARQLLLPIDGRQKEAFQEHQAVIQALEKRDVKLARKKMKIHLNQLILLLTPLEKEHPHLFENS